MGKIKISDYSQHELFRKMGQWNYKAAKVFAVKQKDNQGILFAFLKLSGSLLLSFNQLRLELLV